MRAFKKMPAVIVVFLASLAPAQQPDQLAAARVLGPHWKQISRIAGKIFTGTVISVARERATKRHPLSTLEIKLKVDHGIAGIRTGESISIHEWVGASSMIRPMHPGEKLLLVLYPRSRLGLTSPIGGAAGQLSLDASGKSVVVPAPTGGGSVSLRSMGLHSRQVLSPQNVSVAQLERAIRSVREKRHKDKD